MPGSGTQPSGSSALNPGLAEYTDRVEPSHHGDPDQCPGQDSSAVPSEAGSEVQEPEPHYLASINQVYELIFNTLDDFCPRPTQSIIGSAVTVTEKVARRREPDRVGLAMGRVALRLPIGSTITSAFDTVIRRSLQMKLFYALASAFIASARRKSTRAVYDARWKLFSEWCLRREIDPVNPSSRRIADFLLYLFDDKKLSLSSIKGYRSMLPHTLAFHRSSQVCSIPAISGLIRAMELKRTVSRSLTPKWDLACVLWSLTKSPYEPLDQASLQFLTWKTVFLLTMASAKQRSEIHALSVETGHLRFDSSDGSVTLLCQSGFLAKNQLPSMVSKPFKVQSLSKTCGQDDEDRLLCPVRALKFYLNRVKSIRGSWKRLFIPLIGGGVLCLRLLSPVGWPLQSKRHIPPSHRKIYPFSRLDRMNCEPCRPLGLLSNNPTF